MMTTYEKKTALQSIRFHLRTDEVTGIVMVSVGEMTVEAHKDDASALELSLLEQGYSRIWFDA
jgi:hypothetical protein